MLELDPRPFCQVDGEELDDEVVVLDSRHVASKAIVFQPYVGIRRPIVFGNICWHPHLCRELILANCAHKGAWPWPWWARTTLVPPFCVVVHLPLALDERVVDDVSGVTDFPNAILHGDVRSRRFGGLCPPAPRQGHVWAIAIRVSGQLLINFGLLHRSFLH
jgi:hypothetical protein